jgi:hypothetical protein
MTDPNRECYVYVYYDPRNFQPFYIGKGKDKRLSSHESDPQDTKKTATIRAIKAAGLKPTIRVIAKGLTEEQAFLVEKTLLWSTRGLSNVAQGNFKENFRPDNTLHRALPGFDFSNQIYYFNIGHGTHRLWEENVQYGYVSAGQDKKYSDAIRHLHTGDLIVARVNGTGYVGVGRVVSEPVPARSFLVPVCATNKSARGKPLVQLGLKAKIRDNIDDELKCEWMAGVEWLKTTTREKPHWKANFGLYAPRGVTCGSLANQPKTIKYIEQVFGLSFEELASLRHSAAAKGQSR